MIRQSLSFPTLRSANELRNQIWDPDNKLDLSFKGNELAGETGEVCNVIKKLERERLGLRGSRDTLFHLGQELADVIICADLIAMRTRLRLEDFVAMKFNDTSAAQGFDIFIGAGDVVTRGFK